MRSIWQRSHSELLQRSLPCRYHSTRSTGSNARINALVYTLPSVAKDSPTTGLPLSGTSIAIKDNICTSSMPTTCSSLMLKEHYSPFDATVVRLLQASGANIIGKTNCDEFGMGSLNTYSIHGPVINPFDPLERRSAGGSSGGSAAAVAAGMCDAALGTDTGGSIRLPASYCGVFGFKPSYGLLSRWGVVSFADSLDCVGVFSKCVDHAEQIFDVLNVYDPKDPTAANPEIRKSKQDISTWTSSNLNGLRIGIPREYFPAELHPGVVDPLRRVLPKLQSLGATIKSVSLPSTQYALSAYYVIASAEASSNLARYDGVQYGLRVDPPPGSNKKVPAHVYSHSRSLGFGPEVKRRILLGTYALTADAFDNYFLQAQHVRQLVRMDFDRAFRARNVLQSANFTTSADGVDILVHPSSIRTAPRLDNDDSAASSGLDSYLQDVLTVPASLAGLPALSVPVGSGEDGWPVGVSLVGQWGRDKDVLSLGRIMETLCC